MKSTLTKNQVKIFGPKEYTENGTMYRITAKVRYDDACNNGHNSFSITGTIDEKSKNGRWIDHACGCVHKEIAQHWVNTSDSWAPSSWVNHCQPTAKAGQDQEYVFFRCK
jgi:hypothetical protein